MNPTAAAVYTSRFVVVESLSPQQKGPLTSALAQTLREGR